MDCLECIVRQILSLINQQDWSDTSLVLVNQIILKILQGIGIRSGSPDIKLFSNKAHELIGCFEVWGESQDNRFGFVCSEFIAQPLGD